MSLINSDNFNRADSTSLGTSWTEDNGNWAITSNQLTAGGNASGSPFVVSTTTTFMAAVADMKVRAQVNTAGTNFDGGPVGRKTGTGVFYAVDHYLSGAQWKAEIYRHSALGTSTLVATANVSAYASGDVLILEIQGTSIVAKRDRGGTVTTLVSGTDSNITAAGQAGVYSWTSAPGPTYDNFQVDDFAGGGGTTAISASGTGSGSGTVNKQVQKSPAGSGAGVGAVAKRIAKALSGAGAGTGAGAKRIQKSPTGAGAGTGAVAKLTAKAPAGTGAGSGAVSKRIGKSLAGSGSGTGTLSALVVKTLAFFGIGTGSGTLGKTVAKQPAGTGAGAGVVAKRVAKSAAGAGAGAGTVAKVIKKGLAGAGAGLGSLARLFVPGTGGGGVSPWYYRLTQWQWRRRR